MTEIDFQDIKPGDIYMHSPTDAWSYKAIRRVRQGELASELRNQQKFEHDIIVCQEVQNPGKYYYSKPTSLFYLIQSAKLHNDYPDICLRCGKPAKDLLFSRLCSNKECK